jgi:predicted outer membrane repeat protein
MCRKIVFACILCTLALGSGSAETYIAPGDVNGLWNSSGSPYYIQGDITVQPGEILTVEPGVSIEFLGHYRLTVQGWLYAEGTAEDSILFSASNEVTGWQGIRFRDAPDSSCLSYCTFLHGRATGTGSEARGGAVYAASSNLTISHCSLFGNHATNTGGAISADGSGLIIERCLITGNSADNSGGGIYAVESLLQITHNTISDNAAAWGGGIYFSNDLSSLIINSIVSDNSGNGGISLDASDNISISYSDFNNNGVNFFGALPLGLGNLTTVNANGDSWLESIRSWLIRPASTRAIL